MDLGSDKLRSRQELRPTPLSPVSPSNEYEARLRSRESRVAHYEKLHIRIGNMRLLLAIATAVAIWGSLRRHAFTLWLLLVPAAPFAAMVVYHSRVLRRRSCAQRAVAVYRNGLARIQDRWAGSGRTGERFDVPHHVYAADLDLFGKGSLFELLSLARTRMGEDTLARWLLSPSPVEEIRQRHEAVSELRNQLDLREEVAVLG